jgi:hypothetical protein
MKAWWVDSLDHVFPNAQPDDAPTEWRIAAARNEVVSLQLVVVSEAPRRGVVVDARGHAPLPAPRWRAVGYVPVKKNTAETPPEELAGTAPGLFPDPLLDLGSLSLEPGRAQPVWLTLHVPPETKPGSYRGTVVIADGDATAELGYTVEVAAATLPEERSLKVTNWFWADERVTEHFGVDAPY